MNFGHVSEPVTGSYVHGYHPDESLRLQDQALTLVDLLHADTSFPAGSSVLEAGCGVGAQTVILAKTSPHARITAVDIAEHSLDRARAAVQDQGMSNISFRCADVLDLPFAKASFDHVFVCFLLEHLPDPRQALISLRKVLKPGGTITVIEGDHGSTYFYPYSKYATSAVDCQVELQKRAHGNAHIGRALYPLLIESGYRQVAVAPRMVYVDGSKPQLVEDFIKKTFIAMIDGLRQQSIRAGLISEVDFDRGITDLHRTAAADGVFCYTFFKARGVALP